MPPQKHASSHQPAEEHPVGNAKRGQEREDEGCGDGGNVVQKPGGVQEGTSASSPISGTIEAHQ